MRADGPGAHRSATPTTRGSVIHRSGSAGGGSALMVVVLAAGKGVRMRSRIPKVLHPVAGRPMLLWAIAAARPLAPQRTLVVTNPRHDGVQAALNGEGETVSQAEQLGTGHAVAQ